MNRLILILFCTLTCGVTQAEQQWTQEGDLKDSQTEAQFLVNPSFFNRDFETRNNTLDILMSDSKEYLFLNPIKRVSDHMGRGYICTEENIVLRCIRSADSKGQLNVGLFSQTSGKKPMDLESAQEIHIYDVDYLLQEDKNKSIKSSSSPGKKGLESPKKKSYLNF